MSEIKKTQKLVAVAASLAMVASAGYAVSASDAAALAEETPVTTEVDNEEEVEGFHIQCPLCHEEIVLESEPALEEEVTCPECNQQFVSSSIGTWEYIFDCPKCFAQNRLEGGADEAVPETHECTSCGETINMEELEKDPGDVTVSDEPLETPTVTISNSEPSVGGEVVISMHQQDASKDGEENSFEYFKMSMSIPNLPVKEVRVKESNNLLYSSLRSDPSLNRGTCETVDGNYVFSFDEEYLLGQPKDIENDEQQGGMGYSGTVYTMELVLDVPSDMKDLSQYKDDATGNAVINLGDIQGWTETKRLNCDEEHVTDIAYADNPVLTVRMPKLRAVMTTGKSEAQVYDTMTYEVIITNEGAGAAEKIKIVDTPIDPYATIGIKPVDATLSWDSGAKVSLPTPTIDPTTGNIEVTLPDTVKISQGDRVVLTYTLTAGTAEMRTDAGKGELQKLLEMDAGNRSGERKVVVSAGNAFEDVTAEAAFNLLIPAASATATTSQSEITTGERSQVTTTFRVEGEEASTLIAPKINISDPAVGTVENVKVNGIPYNRGEALRDVPQGSSLILTYDIVAPEDYKPNYNDGISVSSVLSADNLVNNLTSTSRVAVAIPELGVGLDLSDTTPSAEDATDATHPVHVTASFRETSGKAKATGVQLVVFDSAAKVGEDPVSERFANIKLNGVPLEQGRYTIDANSGTMTISVGEIPANGEMKVEYDDYLKEGFEPNGWMNSISTRIQKDASQGVVSNFPTGQEKTATGDFTVQVPEMHIAQEVTDPVSEKTEGEGEDTKTTIEPEVINVGDTVKFKTTFFENNEDMPAAKGRDFKMTTKIEDLFISNKNESDKEVNDKAALEMNDERDAETQVKDAQADGRTYKASQLGITFCPIDEIKLMAGDEDVTDKFDIEMNDSNSELTVTPKADGAQDMTEVPTSMEFSVKMGKYEDENNYDQLAGKEISVKSEATVSNLSRTASAVSKTQIADAELYLTKSAAEKEIAHGMTDTYTITAVNDKDNKFSDNSVARNIIIEDDLDQAAADFGYKIDPSTLKVMMGDEDITSTSEVVVLWEKGNTGFDVKLSRDLDKEETLTITYDATTTEIAADAYSQTLGNVVIATADNAKPAVAFENINYAGVDMPLEQTGNGGDMNGENGGSIDGDGALGGTGDVIPYVIGGVMAIAVIGSVIVLVVRRRNR